MNRVTLTVVLLLLVAAVPAFAVRTVMVVDDVIRMSNAGVTDDAIIDFVKKSPRPFDVNGDDVIAMNDAHVSPAVLKFVIDESAARMKNERAENHSQTTTRETRTVYVRPYYDPFFYGSDYSPYWYGAPYLGFGFGFGFGGHYGGGFRGGFGGGHDGGHEGGHDGGHEGGRGGHH